MFLRRTPYALLRTPKMKHTPQSIYRKKKTGEKITCLSLYDFPTARIADEVGVDLLMVGDSVGMVLSGHENTLSVTVETMLYHTKAVSQAVRQALVVADMPVHSYDDPDHALRNAKRFLQEGGADAVKLEGGRTIQAQLQRLIAAGIPVMGHLGMLPQSVGSQFHIYGKTDAEIKTILEDAQMLDRLGVFAITLECIPAQLAAQITQTVECPTIGIGAGIGTDGQILVLYDILGIHSQVSPRFVRRYAKFEEEIKKAILRYDRDIKKKKFPSSRESF